MRHVLKDLASEYLIVIGIHLEDEMLSKVIEGSKKVSTNDLLV